MRPAGYCRVSSAEQQERQTIQTQTEFLHRFAHLHQFEWTALYLDDGVTGTLALRDRSAGQQLLTDAAAGRFDTLYVYRLDRLSRDPRHTHNAVHELEALGVTVLSCTEAFDPDTPAGRMMRGVLATFAGFERDSMQERLAEGRARKARAGFWVGGHHAPYAYRIVEKQLVVHDPEALVVRSLFARLVEEQATCSHLASWLNSAGIPPPSPPETGRPRGGEWTRTAVAKLIRSPVYRGERLWGKRRRKGSGEPISQAVPAIIETDLWERAQEQLDRNRSLPRHGQRRAPYLLTGLLRCFHCGLHYHGWHPPGKPYYYRCSGKSKATGALCRSKNLSGPAIEAALWEKAEGFLRDPGEELEALAAEGRDRSEEERLRRRAAEVADALAAKAQERERVLSLYRRGRITDQDLDRQLDQLEGEERLLREQAEQAASAVAHARSWEDRLWSAEALLERLRAELREGLPAERKAVVLRELIASAEVETVGEGRGREYVVRVEWRF